MKCRSQSQTLRKGQPDKTVKEMGQEKHQSAQNHSRDDDVFEASQEDHSEEQDLDQQSSPDHQADQRAGTTKPRIK
jgi:hypothetical protein